MKHSQVFIAGAGGLGSPVAIYLAVAGVGQIHICDADKVELSNLNRQVLHPESRLGESKARSATHTLSALNPTIEIMATSDYLATENVAQIVGRPDVVVDCLDNYETRCLLNDYCLAQPEQVYAIYLPAGGTTDLDVGATTDTFQIRWFNPREGGPLTMGTLALATGPGTVNIGQPAVDTDKDWVALVERVQE